MQCTIFEESEGMDMNTFIKPLSSHFGLEIKDEAFNSQEWSDMLERLSKDEALLKHSQNVTYYSMLIFDHMKDMCDMTDKDREVLFLSAFLHDIGKLHVNFDVLHKAAKLTAEELEEIRKHPVFGFEFLGKFDHFSEILDNILHHHERYDGKGYPKGLHGNSIPMISRIIAVADAFDAMTSYRPYKKTYSKDYALGEIIENAGCQFDPFVAECFINLCQTRKFNMGFPI
jgi:HD-GYP domain-containing protein (c-di-GMP phosphodiesterase class II)